MMLKKIVAIASLITLLLGATGCSYYYREPVRHLASDASLLVPGQTTKQEVLSYMGEPDERRQGAAGEEVWIYHQVRKSLLRKTPYLGKKIGQEEYDVMNVTFNGEVLASCVFRLLDEEEFKQGTKKQ